MLFIDNVLPKTILDRCNPGNHGGDISFFDVLETRFKDLSFRDFAVSEMSQSHRIRMYGI